MLPPSSEPPLAVLREIVRKTANIVIAMMSSNDEAAIRVVGIPFFTPYPLLWRIIIDGTNTAGLTAPRVYPWAKHNDHGMLNIHLVATAEPRASRFYGTRVNNTTVSPLPLKSSSIPPLRRMIERHTFLTQPAISSG